MHEYVGPDGTTDTEAGHVVPMDTHLKLKFGIAQADKHFKVCDIGRLCVGNVRDATNEKIVVDDSWTKIQVTKQGRASDAEPWMVEADLAALPKKLAVPGNVGKTFKIDFKSEVQEIERLGLDEPLQINKTIVVRVAAKGDCGAVKNTAAEDKKRTRATTVVVEVYMGQFEVSDAAVNLAMMSLRDQSDSGSKDILLALEHHVKALEKLMVEECARQYEDLGLRAQAAGFDLGQALQMWQLPSELLGGGGEADESVDGLKKTVADLKAQLKAANERIRYLEGASGATRAQQQIQVLRKQMVDKKKAANGGAPKAGDPKSKACVIS